MRITTDVYDKKCQELKTGPRGFEPLQLASKARVLPLDDGPSKNVSMLPRIYILINKIFVIFIIFPRNTEF